ncbi:hypothetical protein [uncultured Aureimonas sp.]|uniref:hypothetical protein n=1 Tax=uncultured Aureimonas sp. TaxID=1604662 RepID=UPI0025E716CB|nr:hypothetical protein [uncultured Aureimonas sp.]
MTAEGETQEIVRIGLIGSDIQRSKSPARHETEGRALGLDDRHSRFDTLRAPHGAMALPDHLEGKGFAGIDVTHPCKQFSFRT